MQRILIVPLFAFALFAGCQRVDTLKSTEKISNTNSSVSFETPNETPDAGGATNENSNENNTSDESLIVGKKATQFFVAEKNGKVTVVYLEDTQNTQTENRTEVFRFDESTEYNPESGNLYTGFGPNVDYSATRNVFAYTNAKGLFLYDSTTKTHASLIEKQGTQGDIDAIPIPVWSTAGLKNGTLDLYYPRFSEDGEYVSFLQAFYEGGESAVIELATRTVTVIASRDPNESIGRYHVVWSPRGHDLAIGADRVYTSSGLFVVTDGVFDKAKNLLQNSKQIVSSTKEVAFVDQDTLVYSYQNEGTGFHSLALIDMDGRNFRDLGATPSNEFVRVAGDQKIFFLHDTTDDTGDGVWMLDMVQNIQSQVLQSTPYTVREPQAFNPRGNIFELVILETFEAKSWLHIFDYQNKIFLYTSPNIVENGTQRFLGFQPTNDTLIE